MACPGSWFSETHEPHRGWLQRLRQMLKHSLSGSHSAFRLQGMQLRYFQELLPTENVHSLEQCQAQGTKLSSIWKANGLIPLSFARLDYQGCKLYNYNNLINPKYQKTASGFFVLQ